MSTGLLLYNGVLFAQEISKELFILCLDYEKGWKSKVISNITVKRRVISKLTVPSTSTLVPILSIHWIKSSEVKTRPVLKKKSYFFHELGDKKSWYYENNYNLGK